MKLFIHRKDLRTHDLPAWEAIRYSQEPSLHILILEPFLLKRGERYREHSGINFLNHAASLNEVYRRQDRQLNILFGEPAEIVHRLLETHPINEILAHRNFTPYGRQRDNQLQEIAAARGVSFTAYDEETLADLSDFNEWNGRSEPYKVYTPFYRRWNTFMREHARPPYGTALEQLQTCQADQTLLDQYAVPSEIVKQMEDALQSGQAGGHAEYWQSFEHFLTERITDYADGRDRYAWEGTSMVSRHLNVGALSVRDIYQRISTMEETPESWLRQLAWRDFYLFQARQNPDFFTYEKRFDFTDLSTDHLQAWAEGRTGIPVIDAAMKQLNETGWMPNRLRMVTAMFLTKNLGCPFIYGERYFRLKLTDYDNVLNRGGWLWSSSLGFDASPYFRVMNPVTQSQTHDPDGHYLRRWLPERAHLGSKEIHLPGPDAIVDLKRSRALAIETYKRILQTSEQPQS
ncbi:deoxyribodipyrimidine photo-lyase [Paenibacillus sp. JX-17]|uniref:Deoxyribodipyrimidine photo-lyase n=1 Tax=Paenibacillus lacisoli TaxID=3064525 RepID=A0ABT9CFW4_9BACL|nr:deoxyribodipyrimidine photo-lyase [Paenibacillus sp. JX-17]MDO7907780.1 deoxyribodipyrimidine photo-lyase [Paenibacillus sp. JX-17]